MGLPRGTCATGARELSRFFSLEFKPLYFCLFATLEVSLQATYLRKPRNSLPTRAVRYLVPKYTCNFGTHILG